MRAAQAGKRHLVVGGAEDIGAILVDILLHKALNVRATTADKWKANDQGPIAWAYLDLESGEGIQQAFTGVDRACIAVPTNVADAHEVVSPLLAEAKRRRLEKVVLLTTAAPDSAVLRCEAELAHSGLRHDILRVQPGDDPHAVAACAAQLLTREDLGARALT